MSTDFSRILASLNTRQREAVETIYGPVLVIAGPGSGKTQLLAARIANILHETDYLPSNILCLTFTENAAKNMRERLARMIGQDAYRVAIHTFHSFGNEILNRYKHLFREYDDANTIDDIVASRFLDDILSGLAWDDPYKPGMRASDTIRDILTSIANLKKGGITPDLFARILDDNRKTLDLLTPLLSAHFIEIDALGQKKDEKAKKIEIFEKFTKKVQQLSINTGAMELGGYDPLIKTISLGLDDAWVNYAGDLSTKFLTAWKDSWTTKDHKGIRIWKEGVKQDKQVSLLEIYIAYQSRLETEGYIDFSDMILRAIELVERDPSIQANLAEQYQFILMDEFQDTNESQMRLVHSILRVGPESPNIFAVGDDDQSIYKFQGANIKNIRDFHEHWNDTHLIILDTNYRSHSEIISTSRAVIKSESSDISRIFPGSKKEFHAQHGEGGVVDKYIFEHSLAESTWIIEDIQKQLERGVSPSEIAIITKKNKSLETLAKGLLEKGIPVSMSRTESIFESEYIMLIIHILQYVASLGTQRDTDEILVQILSHPCWQIPRIELWRLSRDIHHARREDRRSWIDQMSQSRVSEIRDTANFLREIYNQSHSSRLEDLIDMITGSSSISVDDMDDTPTLDQLQIDVLGGGRKNYTSPLHGYFFGQLSSENSTNDDIRQARNLTNLKKYIDQVRSYKSGKGHITLSDMIELQSLIETYDIRIETSHIIGNEKNSVQLITVHKAKGLEWDHVYVPSLHQREYKLGKISGSTLPKNLPLEADKDEDEDIERLVYTAYTRAKKSLHLTYARMDESERNNDPLPCIGLENGDWIEQSSNPDLISGLVTLTTESQHDLFSLPYLGEERDFLSERIDKQFIMSATALQNFLDITSAGPEAFIANNILRFPQAKNIAAAYGTAIHSALEQFFTDYKKTGTYMKELLHSGFEESFKREGFPRDKENEWLTRGHANIEALYTELVGRTYEELTLEKDFRTEGGGVYLGDIQITGKIDRIERQSDDRLIITDYKTGGGFDSFDGKGGEYMRIKQWKYRLQLCFYAILFELSPRYRMFHQRQFELFFVERDRETGVFHRVMEYIHEGEIERTKSLIRAVSRCIQTLDFPDISAYPQTLEGIRMFEEDLLSGQIHQDM